MRPAFWLVLLALLLSQTSSVPGRHLGPWDYDRLFKSSDLIVIAAAETSVDVDPQPQDYVGSFLARRETAFAVRSTLKGKVPNGPLLVRHDRYVKGKGSVNGPLLVQFRTRPKSDSLRAFDEQMPGGPATYLLFLKASGDGRYVPVSGRDEIFSVREVSVPQAADPF